MQVLGFGKSEAWRQSERERVQFRICCGTIFYYRALDIDRKKKLFNIRPKPLKELETSSLVNLYDPSPSIHPSILHSPTTTQAFTPPTGGHKRDAVTKLRHLISPFIYLISVAGSAKARDHYRGVSHFCDVPSLGEKKRKKEKKRSLGRQGEKL